MKTDDVVEELVCVDQAVSEARVLPRLTFLVTRTVKVMQLS